MHVCMCSHIVSICITLFPALSVSPAHFLTLHILPSTDEGYMQRTHKSICYHIKHVNKELSLILFITLNKEHSCFTLQALFWTSVCIPL